MELTREDLLALVSEHVAAQMPRAAIEAMARKLIIEQMALLTFHQAARRLKVSIRTFDEWRSKYGIPEFLAGGIKRVWACDIKAFALARQVRKPGRKVIEFPSVQMAAEAAERRNFGTTEAAV